MLWSMIENAQTQWRSDREKWAALARDSKQAKNCKKNYTHANSDCINLFDYEEQKKYYR